MLAPHKALLALLPIIKNVMSGTLSRIMILLWRNAGQIDRYLGPWSPQRRSQAMRRKGDPGGMWNPPVELWHRVRHPTLAAIATVVLASGPLNHHGLADGSSSPGHSRLAAEACQFEKSNLPRESQDEGCTLLPPLIERARESVHAASTPTETLDSLNHFFFEQEGFQVTYNLDSPEHLFLDGVLSGRKGYCVGLATVYLVLAEDLDLPIHGVATPKHVFLRWDDGKFRRNIELFQKGREVSDEDYVREQRIPKESIERGVFLANLTRKEFLGFIYQNRGVLESQQGNFEASGRDYRQALHLNPKLAAAYYNRGNDELKQKQYRRAIRDYTKALKLYPTDAWALKNRGLAWKELGEAEKAEEDWKRAREIEPGAGVGLTRQPLRPPGPESSAPPPRPVRRSGSSLASGPEPSSFPRAPDID